jgi:uncharacterized protein DUF6526
MSEKVPQTLGNHARFDPWFHFFLIPVFLISWIVRVVLLVRHPSILAAWEVVLLAAAVVAAFKIRIYALKVQDRIIRLEERLRLATLLPESSREGIASFTEDQLVALRFACDSELPALAERCAKEKLSRKDVKKAIQTWRPDYWRV